MGSNKTRDDIMPEDGIGKHTGPIVTVNEGQLEGTVLASRSGRSYLGFLGIPYAEPPERFQLARPAKRWEGIRSAKKYGQRCVQRDAITKQVWGSEDCLFLNVFTPQVPRTGEIAKFPVVVFIHGGFFMMGSGDEYSPKYLLDKDVIVVTLNYRLGILGFCNTEDGLTEGNLALKDQLLALNWVQDNIINFGGDKNRVTLMGQSAGSACVHYHILSPLSRGLFSAAILQSGSALCPWGFQQNPLRFIKQLSKELGGPADDTSQIIEYFKTLDARVLAAWDHDYKTYKPRFPLVFGPSKEIAAGRNSIFISDSPWNLMSSKVVNPVPIIFGFTSHEGLHRSAAVIKNPKLMERYNTKWNEMAPPNLMYQMSSINVNEVNDKVRKFYFGTDPISKDNKDKLTNLCSDRFFLRDIFGTARMFAEICTVYIYELGYAGERTIVNENETEEIYGVSHTDDIQYLFDSTLFPLGLKPGPSVELSEKMVELFTAFISHHSMASVPTTSKFQQWKPVQSSPDKEKPLQYYYINKESRMVEQSEDMMARIRFWDDTLHCSIFPM